MKEKVIKYLKAKYTHRDIAERVKSKIEDLENAHTLTATLKDDDDRNFISKRLVTAEIEVEILNGLQINEDRFELETGYEPKDLVKMVFTCLDDE